MKSLINWFILNKVAANLLMIFIIAGGTLTLIGLKQEVFPEASPDLITVSVADPGATPAEMEEGVCLKVEEVIEGLEGVKRVTSTASENLGTIMAELYQGADKQKALDDIKSRVDAISTFPESAEKPIILEVESPKIVMQLVVSGKTDALTLKRIALEVRDDLTALHGISRVEVANARKYEVSIEVTEEAMQRYGLTFDDVVAAVRQYSRNITGGTLRTDAGEILLRSDAQAYVGRDFEEILLLRAPDGTRITVGDIARVDDGFEDENQWSTLNGDPALTLTVFRIGHQSVPVMAETIGRYLEEKRDRLPEGITLSIAKNWADHLDQRLSLMIKNGKWALVLIFVILALFLRLRVAFWVALGIPTAFLGAIWLLPAADTTINMMSLFGFIVVLGIMVDDAIVVGENINYHSRRGLRGKAAAMKGTHEVMIPVVVAVLTTIAAFVPMLTMPGVMGQFARVIPVVTICALIFSLVESLVILPHHLSHMKPPAERTPPRGPLLLWEMFTSIFSTGLEKFVDRVYRPVLAAAVEWRYLSFAVGIAVILLTAGLFLGKVVRFTFFPPIAGDQVVASVAMPPGTPIQETGKVVDRIRQEVETIRKKLEGDEAGRIIKHVLVTVGSWPQEAEKNWDKGGEAPSGTHLGEVFVQLHPPEKRNGISAEEIMRCLREEVGTVPEVHELRYEVSISGLGAPINVQLTAHDLAMLDRAATRLKTRLAGIDGVFDITDDNPPGKVEFNLSVKPEAEALGITQTELARQVRQGFYGDEVQRIQRGRHDVKVMVRYPRARRAAVAHLENMRIRTPGGGEVPFSTVADVVKGRGPVAIHRAEGKRSVTVTADVDLASANTNEIAARLRADILPGLQAEFPGLSYSFEGEQREQAETLMGILKGALLALLLIYSLLALTFSSFLQPLIAMLAIFFGAVGAVLGHWGYGVDLTLLSVVGLLAMAGVVVNDSMIMIDFVNRARAGGASPLEAVKEAGPRRFRPILLTSLTTFAGLTPLLLETSVQAQFLIPMAISLSFGVVFSTAVILLLVPVAYLMLEDGVRLFKALRSWCGFAAASPG